MEPKFLNDAPRKLLQHLTKFDILLFSTPSPCTSTRLDARLNKESIQNTYWSSSLNLITLHRAAALSEICMKDSCVFSWSVGKSAEKAKSAAGKLPKRRRKHKINTMCCERPHSVAVSCFVAPGEKAFKRGKPVKLQL